MPTWGEILNQLTNSASSGKGPDFDGIRRGYLAKLHQLTGRAVILYSTAGAVAATLTLVALRSLIARRRR